MTKQEHQIRLFSRLSALGFSYEESCQLRRISMTLHHWNEQECGNGNDHCSWSIERDEETNKPFRVVYPHHGPSTRYPIADRETGALARLDKLMLSHRGIRYFHQTDPRGCALYLLSSSDLRGVQETPIDQIYTRGLAICH
jgi:hypothetical protein